MGWFVSSLLSRGFLLPPSQAGGSAVNNHRTLLCGKRPLQVGCAELAGTFTLTVNSCLLAQGHGAKGDNIYEFQIEFLEPVEPKVGILTYSHSCKEKVIFEKLERKKAVRKVRNTLFRFSW